MKTAQLIQSLGLGNTMLNELHMNRGILSAYNLNHMKHLRVHPHFINEIRIT